MSELKLCPFCGGEAYLLDYGLTGARKVVQCSDCGARSRAFDPKVKRGENAINAWNSRVGDDDCVSRQPEHNPDDERKIADLHKMVNYLLSRLEQRWIPVSERLPEEDKNVLVSVHFMGLKQTHANGWNDHIKPSYYVDIASHIDGEWSSASAEYKAAISRHKIIAWMPLPEPYSERWEE